MDESEFLDGSLSQANETPKVWVEPRLVKLEGGKTEVAFSGFYDGVGQSS